MARRQTLYLPMAIMAALLVACTLVALLAFVERKAQAAFPGKNGRIAFDNGGRDDVFVINPDGSGLQNITNNTKPNEYEPAFSADGSKLVYVRKPSNSQNREIVTVNFPGGGQRTTVARSYYYFPDPAFSPDGEKIAFVKRPVNGGDFDTDIYTVNVDGSGLRKLTDANGADSPSWSPDGTKIAFTRDGKYYQALWTMNADGTDKKNLSAKTPGYSHTWVGDPDWSPDGEEIAFERYNFENNTQDIYAVRPDGTNLRNITKTPNIEKSEPAYSPNGQRIAFVRYDAGGGQFDIWAVRAADGSNRVPVTGSATADESSPSWQPIP